MRPTLLVLAAILSSVACEPAGNREGSGQSSIQATSEPSGSLVRQLRDEIEAGRVALATIRGNGNSSGMAITAVATNRTSSELRIEIDLLQPIYLANGGRGQNMVAVGVYLEGGSYYSDQGSDFVLLPPGSPTQVEFIAFCADFDRENPSATDQFSPEEMPNELRSVVSNIGRYLRENPEAEATVPAQVALWMAQGEEAESIQEVFEFTPEEHTLARRIILGDF